MKDRFAFIIHPIDPQRDVARKYPALGRLPVWLIDYLSLFFPPVFISEIRGVQSRKTGHTVAGWFVACPLTPRRMMRLPPAVVYRKVVQTGRLAESLGARIIGLGAFTSVVGDGGITIADRLSVPVTTGDAYTVQVAVRALLHAARKMEIRPDRATAAVVGASGAIGRVCAALLAQEVGSVVLVGRRQAPLATLASQLKSTGRASITVSQSLTALREAELVLSVTSAVDPIIQPEDLRAGAVVCDVSRPRDVSREVIAQRHDVLVIEGGMVAVPGPVDFGFDFGFPPRMAYACMAETMALAVAGRYESFTLGKEIALAKVKAIDALATEHGFRLGGLRSFEMPVSDSTVDGIRERARLITAGHQATP